MDHKLNVFRHLKINAMDNSQSSNIFFDTNVNLCNSTTQLSAIDLQSYEQLLLKIKTDANTFFSAKNSKLSNNFSSFLDDCCKCVYQGLDILVFVLEDSSTPISKLCCYLEEVIYVLEMISNLIKNLIESMAVSFCTMKTFSTTTGNIILSVFSHCKDSELIYDSHIRTVEKQLKDLFRKCHELQLTYLNALEKHFVFNLTESNQEDILIDTLNINLKIGELVQALDVKTMAEQWKAYTVICEKYASFLLDKNIFNKTTKLLVEITHNQIKTALEVSEEDKVVLRSSKVASFCLKILLRICNIFKCGLNNNYEDIVELIQKILLYSSSHNEITKISSTLTNITNTHLLIPSEAIITQLVTDENFVQYIDSIHISDLKDLRLLKYILLLLSMLKASLRHKNMHETNLKMINLVISSLPHCYIYMNVGLIFLFKNIDKNHGLFEHLLIHTLAVATSLDSQYYTKLEKSLYKGILSTEYFCAAFSSNLWVLLCRSSTSQLHLNTLTCLIETYQKLETNKLFLDSPQHHHLSFTIENLFKTLQYPEKLSIYKQFSIYQEKNDILWCFLKIRNLPENLQMSARKVVTQKATSLLEVCNKQSTEYIQYMIQVMKLASTCEFMESDSEIERLLDHGWSKACPKANKIKLQRDLDVHSVFYFRYLEALTALTESYCKRLENNSVVKIVHVISDTLQLGNNEVIKLLFKLFCQLLIFQKNIPTETVIETFKYLLNGNEIDSTIYSVFISNEEFNNFFTQMLNKERKLEDALNRYNEYKSSFDTEWQQRLQIAANNRYTHKCIQNTVNLSEQPKKTIYDSNCEPGCELSLEIDNDNLPVNKKAKLDTKVENILERLEYEVSQLYQLKDNNLSEEYKTRIRNVCDKLKLL